jgi:hypothetical protein
LETLIDIVNIVWYYCDIMRGELEVQEE